MKNKEVSWIGYEGSNLIEAQELMKYTESLIAQKSNISGDNILIRPTKVIFETASGGLHLYRVKIEGEIILGSIYNSRVVYEFQMENEE